MEDDNKNSLFEFAALKTWIFTAILVVLLIALSIISGIYVFAPKHEKNIINNVTANERVVPTTKFRIITHYECGHVDVYETTSIYEGYTKDELGKIEGCRICTFSNEYVCLVFNKHECCTEHYLLMMSGDGVLSVFKTSCQSEKDRLMDISIDSSSIDIEECDKLRCGIIFDSLQEINTYLESMET